jgi:predicted nucleic acid-binding protein
MYLADTNVISAGAPTKRHAPDELRAWLHAHADRIYLSVVTVAEIAAGIAKSRRLGHAAKAERLSRWLAALTGAYGTRILPVDSDTALIAGQLIDDARASAPDFADIAIAATARRHGLTLLTRNVTDFAALPLAIINPFDRLPES